LQFQEVQQFNTQLQPTSVDPADLSDQYNYNWTDQTYSGHNRQYSKGYNQHQSQSNHRSPHGSPFQSDCQKKCYICEKPNCWSTRHPLDRQKEAYNKFYQSAQYIGNQEVITAYFQSFLVQYKGEEDFKSEVNKAKQLLMDMEIEDYSPNQYFTEYGEVDGTQTVIIFND